MQDNEPTFEQRLELVDVELKAIAKIIEEMGESMKELSKTLGLDND